MLSLLLISNPRLTEHLSAASRMLGAKMLRDAQGRNRGVHRIEVVRHLIARAGFIRCVSVIIPR